jgi:RES domain-containing protein
MLLYRICKEHPQYMHDITGTGALHTDGRWHRAANGERILYTSIIPALAKHEIIANYNPLPPHLKLQVIRLTDPYNLEVIKESSLPPNWRDFNPYPRVLADMALQWIRANASVGLIVPSVHGIDETVEYNVLLNPQFPGYHTIVRLENLIDVPPVDPRIKPTGPVTP